MPGTPVPQGELETMMVGKEIAYGQLPTLTIAHCFNTAQGVINTAPVKRAPRASLASPFPGTGGRSVSIPVDVETDADTFPQWLAYTLGAQAAPTATLVNTTVATTQASGSPSLILASTIGIVPGMSLTVDTSTNLETLVVLNITGINTVSFTTNTTKSHNSGVAVVCTATSTAKLTVMKLGSPLPSFTIEINRPGSVCLDYLGCGVDSLTLAMAAKQGLTAKVSVAAQDAVPNNSPTTPSLSSKNPYIFEQQNIPPQIAGELNGVGSGSSLLSFQIQINNNLGKDNFTFGSGNRIRSLIENLRDVSGQFTLYFESQALLSAFNAARTGGALPGVSAIIPIVSTDTIGSSGIPYTIYLYMPNLFLSSHAIADDTSKALQQTVKFTAAESVPGANDQISAYCFAGNSAIY